MYPSPLISLEQKADLIAYTNKSAKFQQNFIKAQERISRSKAMSISGRSSSSSRDGARDEERKKERKSAAKLPFSRRVHVSTRRRQWERSHGPSGISKLGLRLPALNNMLVFFLIPSLFSLALFFTPPLPHPKSNFHNFFGVLFMWRKREDLYFAKKQNGK
jgi:hypothetical protein